MNNLYLFQVQDKINVANNQYWLPYSVGCLWAYAQQFDHVKENWNLREIFFKRSPIDETLNKIKDPKICAFSVYTWNRAYTIEMSKAVKKRWPDCLLVFGGPEISSSWLKYDFVDCLVLGEGETAFVEILELVDQGHRPEVIIKKPRMLSLDDIPSPYVTGVFDRLVGENADIHWCAALETNRGCPYSCTFCDWGGLTQSKIKKFKLQRIVEEIQWLRDQKISVLYITDANFGIFKDRDFEIAELIRRELIDKNPTLEYISLNYEKNSNENVFKIASTFGPIAKGVTFSMQSLNPKTLEVIKRKNMDANNVEHLMALAEKYDLEFYSEMMLGLPEETLESWKHGMCQLLELGQHNRIEVYPVHVLENTELNLEQKIKYDIKIIPVEGAVIAADQQSEIKEYVDTVYSTNTMNTEDLVDAYMYSWMVVNFHIGGYSKLLSKYHRHVHDISYRQFYDNMFEKLKRENENIVHRQYQLTRTAIANIYKTGSTDVDDLKLGNLIHNSGFYFYKNLDQVLEFVIDQCVLVRDCDEGILEIQKRVLLNSYYSLPEKISTSVDIDHWQLVDSIYEVTPIELDLDLNYRNMYYKIRRNHKIYNKIEKIA